MTTWALQTSQFVLQCRSMTSRQTFGGLELMALMAISDLGTEAYGLGVRREVARRSGHEYSVGAIYTTLSRLEGKGWISASMSDPQPVRGGRARRQFQITRAGARALTTARRRADALWGPLQSSDRSARGAGAPVIGEQPA